MPTGERVQISAFYAVKLGTISFTIRKPSTEIIALEKYINSDYFDNCIWVSKLDLEKVNSSALLTQAQKDLCNYLDKKDYYIFFNLAINSKQNIIISGSAGSGKTTFIKALLALIPKDERLLSIENIDGLGVYKTHENAAALFYSAVNQGVSSLSQKDLLVTSLRMKPDRIFLAELLSGEDAFYFLLNVGSGHPGSITTMHATTSGAKEQLVLYLAESSVGAN